jgi:hypothetical protein
MGCGALIRFAAQGPCSFTSTWSLSMDAITDQVLQDQATDLMFTFTSVSFP